MTPRALRIPSDFTPQHANVTLKLSKPIATVKGQIEELHNADKQAESTKKKLLPWLWVCGIGGFLGLFTVYTLPLLAPFCALLFFYNKSGSKDVEDRRLEVARHLLQTLGDEINPTSNVVLEMDFRGYVRMIPRKENGASLYTQEWMRLGMVLKNGAALEVTATTHCKRKSKRKRKYTKHKDKLVETLALDIRPAKGKSFSPSARARIAKALERPLPAARLRASKVKPKVTEILFTTDPAVMTTPGMFLNREHLLDAEKVLALTTLGYRAASHAAPA